MAEILPDRLGSMTCILPVQAWSYATTTKLDIDAAESIYNLGEQFW